MKILFLALLSLSSPFLQASTLSEDFKCVHTFSEGESVEVVIQNIDFAKEISVKAGKRTCSYSITDASYQEHSKAPGMLIHFAAMSNCGASSKLKFAEKGFLKVSLTKRNAYVLALYDVGTLDCKVLKFNQKKLSDRVKNSF